MDVQTDNRPIVVRAEIDKVQEEELARLIGTTRIALKRALKRLGKPCQWYRSWYGLSTTAGGL